MALASRLLRFELKKSPRDEARALQYIVREAHRGVPHYRNAWGATGIRARTVRTVGDLARLPITPREGLLRAGKEEFLHRSCDPQRLVRSSTSGSTGTPVTVFLSKSEVYFRRVSLIAAMQRNVRLRFPLKIVDVGAMRSMGGRDIVQSVGLVKVVHLKRTMPLAEQVARIQQHRARIVQGRPTSLALVAAELRHQGIRSVRPEIVISFGEMLHPPVRKLLEEVFACRVADYYNCEEIGNIAWQCPKRECVMHVNRGTCVLEVVDDDGAYVHPGTEGRVLLTSLYNRAMPFIRYELGDRGTLLDGGPCLCGFAGSSMKLASGRDDDFFVLPDGKLVSPREVFQVVWDAIPVEELGERHIRHIRTLQMVQTAPEEMVVRVVPGEQYSPAIWRGLEDCVRRLWPTMRVTVELVDGVPTDRSGKFRRVSSQVARGRPRWAAESEPPREAL